MECREHNCEEKADFKIQDYEEGEVKWCEEHTKQFYIDELSKEHRKLKDLQKVVQV